MFFETETPQQEEWAEEERKNISELSINKYNLFAYPLTQKNEPKNYIKISVYLQWTAILDSPWKYKRWKGKKENILRSNHNARFSFQFDTESIKSLIKLLTSLD